jgi:hypothetical protein
MSNTLALNPLRALLKVAAALLALVALTPSTAAACSCAAQTVEQAKHAASAIFEGRVTRIDDPQGAPTVHFRVVRSFKGPSHEAAEVHTASNSAACGYGFEQGQSYLVYANDEGGALSTSLCSRTQPIADASEDLGALGLGVTPFDPGPGSDQQTPPAAPAAQPQKGGCASCAIGTRDEHGPQTSARALGAFAVLALGTALGITSRRRSRSRS